jgi:MarR family transcriptional regulator, negative regulator of the multidrug operon emrRAB
MCGAHIIAPMTQQRQNDARTSNLLGALAMGVSDAVRDAAERQTARSGETPAALVALGHVAGLTIDTLSKVLGLSHAGTVRLVDRLAADGLVERRPGEHDGRTVALHLTRSGRERRRQVLAERRAAIDGVLAPLSGAERTRLTQLLEKLLTALPHDPLHAFSICRLCEDSVCAPCPIEAGLPAS